MTDTREYDDAAPVDVSDAADVSQGNSPRPSALNESRAASAGPKLGRSLWLSMIAIGYVAIVGGAVAALHTSRASMIESFSTVKAQDAWNEFVAEAERQASGEGPVQRRVPNSKEPPTLVLLRDYYGTCLAGVWFFSSLMYGVLVFFAYGATHVRLNVGESRNVRESAESGARR